MNRRRAPSAARKKPARKKPITAKPAKKAARKAPIRKNTQVKKTASPKPSRRASAKRAAGHTVTRAKESSSQAQNRRRPSPKRRKAQPKRSWRERLASARQTAGWAFGGRAKPYYSAEPLPRSLALGRRRHVMRALRTRLRFGRSSSKATRS